ncbi:MAG: hypothetical protein GY716_24545, partial [bacterium]|nr:hypothetical protein [bacterium]
WLCLDEGIRKREGNEANQKERDKRATRLMHEAIEKVERKIHGDNGVRKARDILYQIQSDVEALTRNPESMTARAVIDRVQRELDRIKGNEREWEKYINPVLFAEAEEVIGMTIQYCKIEKRRDGGYSVVKERRMGQREHKEGERTINVTLESSHYKLITGMVGVTEEEKNRMETSMNELSVIGIEQYAKEMKARKEREEKEKAGKEEEDKRRREERMERERREKEVQERRVEKEKKDGERHKEEEERKRKRAEEQRKEKERKESREVEGEWTVVKRKKEKRMRGAIEKYGRMLKRRTEEEERQSEIEKRKKEKEEKEEKRREKKAKEVRSAEEKEKIREEREKRVIRVGRKIQEWEEIKEGQGEWTIGIVHNMRSGGGYDEESGNERMMKRKSTAGAVMADIPETKRVEVGLVETWNRSRVGNEMIRTNRVGQWTEMALDRSKIREQPSGGIEYKIAGVAEMKAVIVDELGIMQVSTKDTETGEEREKRISKRGMVRILAYVPRDGHEIKEKSRAERFTARLEEAVHNADKGKKDIIVEGDWNQYTERWIRICETYGLKVVARSGVMVIMGKIRKGIIVGGWIDRRKGWESDHETLWRKFIREDDMTEIKKEKAINMEKIEENKEKYRERVANKLEGGIEWQIALKEAAEEVTKEKENEKDEAKVGTYLPKGIQEKHKKLKEMKERKNKDPIVIKRMEKNIWYETMRWRRRGADKRVKALEKQYEENKKKWVHRTRIKEARKPDLLTAVTKEGIEVQSKEEVEEELLRGIGSRWETPKERELSEEMKGKWKKYTERIGGLEGIGGEPEDE